MMNLMISLKATIVAFIDSIYFFLFKEKSQWKLMSAKQVKAMAKKYLELKNSNERGTEKMFKD